MDDHMMTVNNFFGHWFRDIDIRRYPDDMMILPTNNSFSIANYSNAQMKHLPAKSVKKLLKTMLYYNIDVVYNQDDMDRRSYNSATDKDRTDPNLDYQLANLKDFIFKKNVYEIPLTPISDLGKCNFTVKTDTKFIITLERNMNKLFESNKKVTAIPSDPDERIDIDMRRSKGYTDELEKTNRDDIGIALNIKLKKVAAKKLRCRITAFSQAEYWYLLSNKEYVMSYKNYNISKADTY